MVPDWKSRRAGTRIDYIRVEIPPRLNVYTKNRVMVHRNLTVRNEELTSMHIVLNLGSMSHRRFSSSQAQLVCFLFPFQSYR